MLYTDLDKIPLDTFIDVFTGDKSKLIIKGRHSDEELSEQSEKLVTEYVEIITRLSSAVIAERTERKIKMPFTSALLYHLLMKNSLL